MSKKDTRKKRTGKGSQRSRLRVSPWWLVGGLVALLIVGAVGIAANAALRRGQEAAELELPDWVQRGSEKIQRGYIAATLHAEELQYIPCYCSCERFGHTAVIDCFISGTDATGAPVYDNHASY